MGYLRFILALFVYLSHVGVTMFTLNPGVIAVVIFFLLSGYVMTAKIETYYLNIKSLHRFYLDRFLRIYPQFFLYTTLTLILVVPLKTDGMFFLDRITADNIILNYLLLPLGFYNKFTDLQYSILIPPAWSLGLEALFYALIPLILVFRVRLPSYLLSVPIFCLAVLNYLDTETYSYRNIFGTLFMFLCGSFMFDAKKDRSGSIWVLFTWLLSLTLFCYVSSWNALYNQYSASVLVGLIFGIPTIWFLRDFRGGKLDKILGNLSYGVFLNHFLVMWLLRLWFNITPTGYVGMTLSIIFSCILAHVTFTHLESSIYPIRKRLKETERQHKRVIPVVQIFLDSINNNIGALYKSSLFIVVFTACFATYIAFIHRIDYEFTGPLSWLTFTSGLSAQETDTSKNKSFCWGEGPSTLVGFVVPTRQRLQIKLVCDSILPTQDITLIVNGHKISNVTTPATPWLSGALTTDFVFESRAGLNIIELRYSDWNGLNGSVVPGESRKLALAIQTFQVSSPESFFDKIGLHRQSL